MKEVKLVDSKDLNFNIRGDTPGMAYVARALTPEVSPNIGVGFAKWEGAEVVWTVLYDEVIFIIEGCLEVMANGKNHSIYPGQMLWIPEETELTYGGNALFGYVVHPGNWKEIHGIK